MIAKHFVFVNLAENFLTSSTKKLLANFSFRYYSIILKRIFVSDYKLFMIIINNTLHIKSEAVFSY